ncbi:sulfate transporter family protein [Oryzibacter oryziterrae]|uniref:sulfate transporter family protein n=1 Tax=Oryzibacter oryziterrae TaxID=2766474 RepID=UPI001F34A1B1|nr:sulfate transporter family protein [Oryzibacter oryziterrae]
MLSAALLAFQQIFSPPFRSVFWRSIGLTVGLLAVVWIGVHTGMDAMMPALPENWLWFANFVTGLVLAVGLGFLVAPVTGLFAGLFLDEVAEVVERTHYPQDPPGKPLDFWTGLASALRFTGLLVVVNAALLLLLLLPGVNVPIFFVVNAYLIGREYFEFVASRFHDPQTVRQMRQRFSGKLFLAGLIITAVLAVPILNLLTPLFATALMVHVYKALARIE